VQMVQESQVIPVPDSHAIDESRQADEKVSFKAEGGLNTEARQIKAQASQARRPEEGENLLQPTE
jgi:hypothetical protein